MHVILAVLWQISLQVCHSSSMPYNVLWFCLFVLLFDLWICACMQTSVFSSSLKHDFAFHPFVTFQEEFSELLLAQCFRSDASSQDNLTASHIRTEMGEFYI